MRAANVLLLVGAAVSPSVSALVAGDFASRTVEVDGGNGFALPYRVYVPAACGSRRCPIVVFLHGAGETGSNNTAQLGNRANGAFNIAEFAEADGQPAILAAPQAPQWWSNEGPTGGIADMLDDIQRESGFDPARVYVTGLSMGGGGTLGFLQRYDAVAAAAAPICPAGSITSDIDRNRFAALPLWFFHAIDDGTVTVANSQNSIAALRAAGGDPLYTQYQTGNHWIWGRIYPNPRLTDWLLAQRWRTPMRGTDPALALTAPTARATLYSAADTLSLAGSVLGVDPQVTSIAWSFGDADGVASGVDAFTAGPLAVPDASPSLLRVRATGASYGGDWGGNTTYSRTVRVIASQANRAPRAALWIEPVVRVGMPQRLRALVDDDAQPRERPQVTFVLVEGPDDAAIEVDAAEASLAWWTPTVPGVYRFAVEADDGALQTTAAADVLVLDVDAPRPAVTAINSGGGAYTDGNGTAFLADAHFTGGAVETLGGLTTLLGTEDDPLHHAMRRGNGVRYDVPLPNGRYLVVLHLSEWRWFAQVARGMDVTIEGEPVLRDFDLYRWAGLRQAMRLGFAVRVQGGVLDLAFARSAGATTDPRIDAIEVLRLPQEDAVFRDGFEVSAM